MFAAKPKWQQGTWGHVGQLGAGMAEYTGGQLPPPLLAPPMFSASRHAVVYSEHSFVSAPCSAHLD